MTEVGGIAVDRLRSLIERIERLEEEKKAIAGDIRDIFAEAKSAGFDVKVMQNGRRRPRRKGTSLGNLPQSLGNLAKKSLSAERLFLQPKHNSRGRTAQNENDRMQLVPAVHDDKRRQSDDAGFNVGYRQLGQNITCI